MFTNKKARCYSNDCNYDISAINIYLIIYVLIMKGKGKHQYQRACHVATGLLYIAFHFC